MNPIKDIEGVEETGFLTYKTYVSMGNNSIYKAYVSMGNNSIKNSQIIFLKAHAHLHIIGRKSSKFQMNPMKDVGGGADTRSWLAKFKSA